MRASAADPSHLHEPGKEETGMSVIEDLPPTISVEEAGDILGVSRRSAYRAAARGEIPTLRIGRRLLVPTRRLMQLLGLDSQPTDAPHIDDREPLA